MLVLSCALWAVVFESGIAAKTALCVGLPGIRLWGLIRNRRCMPL
jgi:hypothetical protein